ncbi:MAG: hypothetical protein V3W44_07170 [Dehalococcoidales bacterium]
MPNMTQRRSHHSPTRAPIFAAISLTGVLWQCDGQGSPGYPSDGPTQATSTVPSEPAASTSESGNSHQVSLTLEWAREVDPLALFINMSIDSKDNIYISYESEPTNTAGFLKVDKEGTELWRFEIPPDLHPGLVKTDANDDIYFVGNGPRLSEDKLGYGILWKLSGSGDELWNVRFDLDDGQLCSLMVDMYGRPHCVAGYPGLVRRYSPDGELLQQNPSMPEWPGTLGGAIPCGGGFYVHGSSGADPTMLGRIGGDLQTTWQSEYIAGWSFIRFSVDSACSLVVASGDGPPVDLLSLRSYGEDGNLQWEHIDYDHGLAPRPGGLAIDELGTVFIVGMTRKAGTNDVGEEVQRPDVFAASYSPEGDRLSYVEWGTWGLNEEGVDTVLSRRTRSLYAAATVDENTIVVGGWILKYRLSP